MFTSLTVENFKAFGESQSLRLRPITLLFGTNSSGKSSALQALLVLKQTLEESEDPDRALLPKGSLLDLGSFEELSFRHRTEPAVRIGLGIRHDRPNRGEWRPVRDRGGDVEYDHTVFSFRMIAGSVELESFEFQSPIGMTVLRSEPDSGRPRSEGRNESQGFLFGGAGRFGGKLFRPKSVSSDPRLYGREWIRIERDLAKFRKQMADEVHTLSRYVKILKARMESRDQSPASEDERALEEEFSAYNSEIKRLRAALRRTRDYNIDKFIEDSTKHQLGLRFRMQNFLPTAVAFSDRAQSGPLAWLYTRSGKSLFDQRPGRGPGGSVHEAARLSGQSIRMHLARMVYLGPLRAHPARHYIFSGSVPTNVGKAGGGMPDLLFKTPDLVVKVNEWLGRFGADCEIAMSTVKDEHIRDVYSLRLKDKSTGVSVSALDVGFGISQILPILVQGLLSREKILLIEQPEIHLHPRLQAEFGSFLAEAIGDDRRNQFIIETHSEHLLLRLQRLVRKGTLRREDVSVLYVQKTKNGAVTSSLRMDEQGAFIDRWPDGFFEEGFAERFDE